jgi:hypothetical protein
MVHRMRLGTDPRLDLSDLDPSGADISEQPFRVGSAVSSRPANLVDADLRRTDLRGAIFRGVVLTRTDLRGADLRGVDFRGVNPVFAELESDFGTADFRGALADSSTRWSGMPACLRRGCRNADGSAMPVTPFGRPALGETRIAAETS